LPFADTPIIRKNRAMRKASAENNRRSSSGMRGRRASSLVDEGRGHGMFVRFHSSSDEPWPLCYVLRDHAGSDTVSTRKPCFGSITTKRCICARLDEHHCISLLPQRYQLTVQILS
jgi:hypothetical protein